MHTDSKLLCRPSIFFVAYRHNRKCLVFNGVLCVPLILHFVFLSANLSLGVLGMIVNCPHRVLALMSFSRRSAIKQQFTYLLSLKYCDIFWFLFFRTIKWNYCILDEGHIIKNSKTKVIATFVLFLTDSEV